MKTIAVVTVARSDFGIYLPVLRRIEAAPDLRLQLLVSGMHLSPEFGRTVNEIEEHGFAITERVEMLVSSDTPQAIAKSMGLGVIGFAQIYERLQPDMLMVLGDRFEMYVAALSALPFKLPIAHIHGGELTQGAIDDALRHSITKLSHLHFVATEEYGRRVQQLGEEPWRVTVSGAPALDHLQDVPLMSAPKLHERFGLRIEQPPLLATYHPVTLEHENTAWQVGELLAALEEIKHPVIFTKPNADTNGRIAIDMIADFANRHRWVQMVDNLGTQGYFSLMHLSAAMVGNSSSGIIEAPSFKLPVVNIGKRQEGRVRAANVIDVGYQRDEILTGMRRALDPSSRTSLSDQKNPYGDGAAAARIVKVLCDTPLDSRLIMKRFHNIAPPLAA